MAYWLDRLPPQPVLDGFERFNPCTSKLIQLDLQLASLPTFSPHEKSSTVEYTYTIRDFMQEFDGSDPAY